MADVNMDVDQSACDHTGLADLIAESDSDIENLLAYSPLSQNRANFPSPQHLIHPNPLPQP